MAICNIERQKLEFCSQGKISMLCRHRYTKHSRLNLNLKSGFPYDVCLRYQKPNSGISKSNSSKTNVQQWLAWTQINSASLYIRPIPVKTHNTRKTWIVAIQFGWWQVHAGSCCSKSCKHTSCNGRKGCAHCCTSA